MVKYLSHIPLAPNQYAHEKVNLDHGPAYTMRPKTNIEKPSDVPGE